MMWFPPYDWMPGWGPTAIGIGLVIVCTLLIAFKRDLIIWHDERDEE